MKNITKLLMLVLVAFCLLLVGCSGEGGNEETDTDKVKKIATNLLENLDNKEITQISINEKGVCIYYHSDGYFHSITNHFPDTWIYIDGNDVIIAQDEGHRQSYSKYTYLTADGAKEKFLSETIEMISVDMKYFDVKDEAAIFELGKKLTNESISRCDSLLYHTTYEDGGWNVTINSMDEKTNSFSLSFTSEPFRDLTYTTDMVVQYENYVFENGLLAKKDGRLVVESTGEVLNSWEYTLSVECEKKIPNVADYILSYHYIEGQE